MVCCTMPFSKTYIVCGGNQPNLDIISYPGQTQGTQKILLYKTEFLRLNLQKRPTNECQTVKINEKADHMTDRLWISSLVVYGPGTFSLTRWTEVSFSLGCECWSVDYSKMWKNRHVSVVLNPECLQLASHEAEF